MSQMIEQPEFITLLAKHSDEMRAFVARRIPPSLSGEVNPEDVLQEIWLAAIRNHHRFLYDDDTALKAWLYKIARARLADMIRAKGRAKRGGAANRLVNVADVSSFIDILETIAHSSRSPSRDVAAREAGQTVREMIDQLPDDQAMAVRLRFIEGVSRRDIAIRMNRSLPAVNGLLDRAVERLRAMLGNPGSFFSDAREISQSGGTDS
jgi:RNA polymerase sigma-70 factor (ECF subfamily)